MRQLQCLLAARFHRTSRRKIRGAAAGQLRELRCVNLQMRHLDLADFDIARVGIAPEQLLELELFLVLLLMVHRVLLQDLSGLELRLDQVLLETLPNPIPGFGNLLYLLKFALIAIENLQRPSVVEQLEVDLLDPFLDIALGDFVTMLGELGVFFRLGFLQTELARTWNFLRDAKAGVIKVAALITRERLRTSDREVLERNLRIGQRRCLYRYLRLSLPMAPRREHDRATSEGLIDQRPQLRRSGDILRAS